MCVCVCVCVSERINVVCVRVRVRVRVVSVPVPVPVPVPVSVPVCMQICKSVWVLSNWQCVGVSVGVHSSNSIITGEIITRFECCLCLLHIRLRACNTYVFVCEREYTHVYVCMYTYMCTRNPKKKP